VGISLSERTWGYPRPVPIPDFVRDLRRHVGTASLWLPGVTAVVRRDDEVLLVQRSDTGAWSPVTGIVDPGEQPGVAARREVLEETDVHVSVDRLAAVEALPPMTHVNGDQATYLDLTFACTYLRGDAHVADDESVDVRWFRLDALPAIQQSVRDRMEAALAGDPVTRFVS
jgi:8-oxo-dGTP pyrophosphatase MutT (NUDIX family)